MKARFCIEFPFPLFFFLILFRGVFLELLRSSAIIFHNKVSTCAGRGSGNLLTHSVSVPKLLVKKRRAVNFHWSWRLQKVPPVRSKLIRYKYSYFILLACKCSSWVIARVLNAFFGEARLLMHRFVSVMYIGNALVLL